MSGTTKIEWTATVNPDGSVTPGKVWNPTVGCKKVSQGCKNCYAKNLHDRWHGAYLAGAELPGQYAYPFEQVQMMPERLNDPLKWRKPARIFVNSVSDLFHPDVDGDFIGRVFRVMEACPQHTFMILTKRPALMWQWFDKYNAERPLPNVWLGVSAEDQRTADERIPLLLQTPAAVRFVSCEPLLGELDISQYLWDTDSRDWGYDREGLSWVIAGGESGPNARPMHPDWARSLRDQCQAAGTPFFFKQVGEWTTEYPQGRSLAHIEQTYQHGAGFYRIGKAAAGRLLDRREYNDFPGNHIEREK
jgi:protein gp37